MINNISFAHISLASDSSGNSAASVFDRSFCVEYEYLQKDPVVTIGGNPVYYTEFFRLFDGANNPVECKIADGSDYAMLNSTDYNFRVDGSASHLQDPLYFQGALLRNFNIGYFFDPATKKKQIWFNMDTECPVGFHRFIPSETKIFARYNSDIVGGKLVSCAGITPANSKSLQDLRSAHAATNPNLLEETYWEHCCLAWLAVAKLGTRNIQAIYPGMESGTFYGQWQNGNGGMGQFGQEVVEVTKSDGTKVTTKPYRMWHMENPLHADAWIICAGGITKLEGDIRYLYVSRDPDIANTVAAINNNSVDGFDAKVQVLRFENDTWMLECRDYWTVGEVKGGSSTTGTCDYNYGINAQTSNNISLVGGSSSFGSNCGLFALYLHSGSSSRASSFRGRAAMKR